MFIENKGQWDSNVLYKSEIPSGQLYIEKNRFLFNFYDAATMASYHQHGDSSAAGTQVAERSKPNLVKAHAYEVAFVGCNSFSTTEGISPSSYSYNYFKGDDKSKWGSDAKAYKQTVIHGIYPNTNLVCFGQETGFKYEFHLAAGGDPALIQMKYSGADSVYLKNGELFIETSVTNFYEQKPFAYQEINGTRIPVPCQFKLINNTLSFSFPKGYSKKFPLIIDPQLIFSTYSGSTADNWGNSATYDDEGNTYMVGIVFDQGYPATVGAYQYHYNGYQDIHLLDYTYFLYKFDPDIAIMKFNPTGKLLYATYLGGSATDMPSSCIVNSNNELVIFGMTSSDGRTSTIGKAGTAFPTTPGAYDRTFNGGSSIAPFGEYEGIYFDHGSDLFISTLNKSGNQLLHSTFVGGTSNDGLSSEHEPITRNYGDQLRGEIFSDNLNNVYVVTKTYSSNIVNPSVPGFDKTLNGPTDAYLCKLTGDLSNMIWDTYVGGNAYDAGYSIRVASDHSVYVTGGTTSTNLPGTASGIKSTLRFGDTDGFVSHISADGTTLIGSTYVGTESYDQCFFIQLDAHENIYVLGQTTGNYPMSTNVYGKPSTGQFIQKIDPTLSQRLLSTTFGNNRNTISIVPTAFLVNKCDNILISGWGGYINTLSSSYMGGDTKNLDVTNNARYKYTDGSDFYLLVLEKEFKNLLYATYYGGYGEYDHVDGGTSRFDKNGIIYQSVCASCGTGNATAPLHSRFPTTPNALSKRKGSENCNNACFKFDLSSLKANFDINLLNKCEASSITIQNRSIGGVSFEWDFGDGTKRNGSGPFTHYYSKPGTYTVKLIAIDLTTCTARDTAVKAITIFPKPSVGVNLRDTTVCNGDTVSVLKNCNLYYTYSWSPINEVINPNACDALFHPSKTRLYFLEVSDSNGCKIKDTLLIRVAALDSRITWENMTTCNGKPTVRLTNPSSGPLHYSWTFGDGSASDEISPVHEYAKGGAYPVSVDVYNNYCATTATGVVKIDETDIPNLFTPNGDNKNDCFEVAGLYPNWHVEIYNAWSKSIFKSDSYKNEFCGDDVSSGVYYYLVCAPYGDCCKSWVQIIKDK